MHLIRSYGSRLSMTVVSAQKSINSDLSAGGEMRTSELRYDSHIYFSHTFIF